MNVDVIIYKGISFKRYPDSKNASDRNYYRPHSGYIIRGVGSLHREIWKDKNGEIPDGYHIHHKDGNPLNNDISNLACLPPDSHHRIHSDWGMSDEQKEKHNKHLERIRPLTKEWHASDEGIEWHREHGKEVWEKHKDNLVVLECAQCGQEYEVVIMSRKQSKFCSNKCKSAYRRDSGVDDEDRKCAFCGSAFRVNKYSKKRCCSVKCAWGKRKQENDEEESE